MSYSLHGSAASSIEVQFGTDEQIADSIGGDPSDSLEQRLVLNDMGNQHALVIEGTPLEMRELANEILAVVDKIDPPAPVEPSLTLYISEGCEAEVEAMDEIDQREGIEHVWVAVDQDGNDVQIRLAKGTDEHPSGAY